MTLKEQHLLEDFKVAENHLVNIILKGSREPIWFRLNHVMQSQSSSRPGRWIAMVDNGMCQTLDILEQIESIELRDMYTNWGEINKVACSLTRAALIGSKSPAAITKLKKVYPECFAKTPPVPVTWKQLHGKSVEIMIAHGATDEEYTSASAQWHLLEALEFFNIPTVLLWDWREHCAYPPKTLTNQLIGKKIKQPVYVDYNGIRCIPAHIPFSCGTPNSNHAYQGSKKVFQKSDTEQLGLFALVAAEMIIFE